MSTYDSTGQRYGRRTNFINVNGKMVADPAYNYISHGGEYRPTGLKSGTSPGGDMGGTGGGFGGGILPGGGAAGGGATGGVNPYASATANFLTGASPTMGTTNKFEAGLGTTMNSLNALMSDPNSINQSAAYKFRVGQGQEALERSLGAKGLLESGNRLTELTKYGQDMGSQEYENQAQRLQQQLGTYGQGYLGERGANTGQFAAEAAARTGTGNMFASLLGAGNQGQGIANQYALGLGDQGLRQQEINNQLTLGTQPNYSAVGGGVLNTRTGDVLNKAVTPFMGKSLSANVRW